MVDATQSSCIHHPSKPAVNRCKQCLAPTCHPCTVVGPTGKFCSEACKETHQAFIQRAQAMESTARSTFFVKLRSLLGSLLVFLAVCIAAGVVGTVFQIPLLSDLTYWVRTFIGI